MEEEWEEFQKIRALEQEERVRAREEEWAKIRSESKTLVYWDIQNMHLPGGYDLKLFSLNISTALERVNYKGTISIVAFGDVSKIPSNIQQHLLHAEIEIKDVPGDHWWLNYEFKGEIEKNSQDANLLLITDDDDYAHTSRLVYRMIHPVYSILLGVTDRPANTAFFNMAKHIWLWPELIRGGSPLSSECVSIWLQLSFTEWYATFPDSDELSSEQDVDCSLSLKMCPEIRAMEEDEEEEIRYWEEFQKIRALEQEERVRAREEECAKIRSVSKTLVYWNIQNMHLPEEYDLKSFSLNISMAMDRVNYKGHISIVAFGDVSKIPSNIQQQLHHAEIEIKDVPGDHWWLNDEFKDEIEKNSQDANSLLITDDDDYDHTSHLVYEMIHPVYSILLGVTKRPANTAFFSMAKHIWLWPELIRGGSPLSSDCVSNWLKLAITEWHATFLDSDELSSEQDVDCSLSLEMCPEIRAMEEEEEEDEV